MPIRTINQFEVLGRMAMDPVYREATDKSQSRAWFKLAVGNERGGRDQKPSYFNIVAWDRNANNIVKWCGKGKELLLRGRLENCLIEQADGSIKEETSLVVEQVIFGDDSQKQRQASGQAPAYREQQEVPKTGSVQEIPDWPEFTEDGQLISGKKEPEKKTAEPLLEKSTVEALKSLGVRGSDLLDLVKDLTVTELEKKRVRF